MAAEKTILTVDLYDNVLTEKQGDYIGKVRITGTVRNSDVASRIVAKRTEYRQETIENILRLADEEKRLAITEGKSVVDGVGQYLLNISGVFAGKKDEYKSDSNKIGITFTPSLNLTKSLDSIYVNADIATVGPMIESITDSTTGKRDSQLTPGAPAIITGNNILLKGDAETIGVFFTPEAGGSAVKAPLIVTNTKSQIILSLPQLADGQYYLSVTTQATSNYQMVKEPRSYTFPILLTVGEGSDVVVGEDSDGHPTVE